MPLECPWTDVVSCYFKLFKMQQDLSYDVIFKATSNFTEEDFLIDFSSSNQTQHFHNLLWLRSGQPFMVWVWIWKFLPINVKFFNFFTSAQKKSLWIRSKSTRVKGGSASYLLWVKSKLKAGWVRAHL